MPSQEEEKWELEKKWWKQEKEKRQQERQQVICICCDNGICICVLASVFVFGRKMRIDKKKTGKKP